MKTIPLDTRTRILARYDTDKLTRAETAEQFGVSVDFVKKLLKQRKRLGHKAIAYALSQVTAGDARSFFESCGYTNF